MKSWAALVVALAAAACHQSAALAHAQKDSFDAPAPGPARAGDAAAPPPPPPPKYFLKPDGVTNRAGCKDAAETGKVTPVTGKIFTKPGSVAHCIWSEVPSIRGWHLGTKGDSVNCVGQCCEFWPPADREGRRPAKPERKPFSWYEIAADGTCEQNPSSKFDGPPLVEGSLGQKRTMCLNPNSEESQEFLKFTVELVDCGYHCCAFAPIPPE